MRSVVDSVRSRGGGEGAIAVGIELHIKRSERPPAGSGERGSHCIRLARLEEPSDLIATLSFSRRRISSARPRLRRESRTTVKGGPDVCDNQPPTNRNESVRLLRINAAKQTAQHSPTLQRSPDIFAFRSAKVASAVNRNSRSMQANIDTKQHRPQAKSNDRHQHIPKRWRVWILRPRSSEPRCPPTGLECPIVGNAFAVW